jgi:hypothetical protein
MVDPTLVRGSSSNGLLRQDQEEEKEREQATPTPDFLTLSSSSWMILVHTIWATQFWNKYSTL